MYVPQYDMVVNSGSGDTSKGNKGASGPAQRFGRCAGIGTCTNPSKM